MIGDKHRYAVVCGCTGDVQLIALIDDHRPGDHPQSALRGLITITGPSKKRVASGLPSTLAVPEDEANAERMSSNVTEIVWGDGHVEWTLRCLECGKNQVQMHRDTIRAVADRLAESLDHWRVVPIPDSDEPERHMVPLSVLSTMLGQQDR
jgi:hypothetical protein